MLWRIPQPKEAQSRTTRRIISQQPKEKKREKKIKEKKRGCCTPAWPAATPCLDRPAVRRTFLSASRQGHAKDASALTLGSGWVPRGVVGKSSQPSNFRHAQGQEENPALLLAQPFPLFSFRVGASVTAPV
jgi:hypothetical protein